MDRRKRQWLLSAVAITDEMLATMKRLPISYTKEDSPTFIIDENVRSFRMVVS